MSKESRSQKEEHYVNLYRTVFGSNSGLFSLSIKRMSDAELDTCIHALQRIQDRETSKAMYRMSWTDDELREELRESFEREPTAEEIERFKEYLDQDLGSWMHDNVKSFTRKLSEEGKLCT